MARIAGIDIGGTNVKGAIVEDDHSHGDIVEIPTPTDGPTAVVDTVAQVLEDLGGEVEAVGCGIPGPVDEGVLSTPPNLANFDGTVDVAQLLRDALEVPVALGNDVNVAVLGEWLAGAGRDSRNLLGVWMGTGVGGGLILDGRPFSGMSGAAGEFGHTIVRAGGAQCGCGRRGCVEAYAGRNAMEATVRRAVEAGAATTSLFEIARDKDKDRFTSGVWAKALKNHDDLATRIFDEAIDAVAIGIASAISLLDLDRVVLGGGVAEKLGDDLLERVRTAVAPHCFLSLQGREFAVAELGDFSGIVGAAALGRAALVTG